METRTNSLKNISVSISPPNLIADHPMFLPGITDFLVEYGQYMARESVKQNTPNPVCSVREFLAQLRAHPTPFLEVHEKVMCPAVADMNADPYEKLVEPSPAPVDAHNAGEANSVLSYTAHKECLSCIPPDQPINLVAVGPGNGRDLQRIGRMVQKMEFVPVSPINIRAIDICPGMVWKMFGPTDTISVLVECNIIRQEFVRDFLFCSLIESGCTARREGHETLAVKVDVDKLEHPVIPTSVLRNAADWVDSTLCEVVTTGDGQSAKTEMTVRCSKKDFQHPDFLFSNSLMPLWDLGGFANIVNVSNCLHFFEEFIADKYDSLLKRDVIKLGGRPLMFYGIIPDHDACVFAKVGRMETSVESFARYVSADGRFDEPYFSTWYYRAQAPYMDRVAMVLVPGKDYWAKHHLRHDKVHPCASLHQFVCGFIFGDELTFEDVDFEAECEVMDNGHVILTEVLQIDGILIPDYLMLRKQLCQSLSLLHCKTLESDGVSAADVIPHWDRDDSLVGGEEFPHVMGQFPRNRIKELDREFLMWAFKADGVRARIRQIDGMLYFVTEGGRGYKSNGPIALKFQQMYSSSEFFQYSEIVDQTGHDFDGIVLFDNRFGKLMPDGTANENYVRVAHKVDIASSSGVIVNPFTGETKTVDVDGVYEVYAASGTDLHPPGYGELSWLGRYRGMTKRVDKRPIRYLKLPLVQDLLNYVDDEVSPLGAPPSDHLTFYDQWVHEAKHNGPFE